MGRAERLDAAAAVFLGHGYANTTIELVVARAGASRTTIYRFSAPNGELHLRVMTGLPPKDLVRALEMNIEDAVRVFWRLLRPAAGCGPA